MLDHAFLFGVAVAPDDRAQPAGDGGTSLAAVFEVAGEALDDDPAHVEQTVVVLPAPSGELPQVQAVGVAGVAAVAGQESEHRHPLDVGQHRLIPRQSSGGSGHGPQPPCSRGGRPRPQRSKRPQPVNQRRYAPTKSRPDDTSMPFSARRQRRGSVIRCACLERQAAVWRSISWMVRVEAGVLPGVDGVAGFAVVNTPLVAYLARRGLE